MILAGPALEPDEARARVLEELAKGEYAGSDGFVAWLLSSIEDWIDGLLEGVHGSSALGTGVALLGAVLLVVVLVLVIRRSGLIRRGAVLGVDARLGADARLSGKELRDRSRAAIDDGLLDDGTVLALRALVRDLEERTLLDATTGMTAHEAAREAGAAFPDLRARLLRAADAFDMAAYSHRSVRRKQADDLLRLAEYVAEAAPDLSAPEQDLLEAAP
ncbi:DUF4129 domain-containing protein [Brachybacterium sp. DNPG3]